jgi:hypothetical protein
VKSTAGDFYNLVPVADGFGQLLGARPALTESAGASNATRMLRKIAHGPVITPSLTVANESESDTGQLRRELSFTLSWRAWVALAIGSTDWVLFMFTHPSPLA